MLKRNLEKDGNKIQKTNNVLLTWNLANKKIMF
jgi:hypothetical protein